MKITILILIITIKIWAQSNYDNIRIFPSPNDQTEISTAIDPKNQNKLFCGANTYNPNTDKYNQGYYYSSDNGMTWNGGDELPYLGSGATDPSVCFDLNGNVYFTYLKTGDTYEIKLQKFNWITKTWEQPTLVGEPGDYLGPDKPFMTIDQNESSEYKNTVYISFIESSRYIRTVLFYSYNPKTNTFSTKTAAAKNNTSEGYQAPNLAIGPEGQVYLIYILGGSIGVPAKKILFESSGAGGNEIDTLNDDIHVSNINQIGIRHNNYFVLKDNQIRVNSFPSMAVDCSNGPYRGNIYVVWADDRYGTPDILLMKSTDKGKTWNGPIVVNDVLENDQWHPWIDVGPDGAINVIYYDSRNDPNNELADVYIARSMDGGDNFINFPINNNSLDLHTLNQNNSYWGDYISVLSAQNKIYGFWMDNRNVDGNNKPFYQIYMAIVNPFEIIIDQQSLVDQRRINENMYVWEKSVFKEFTPPDTFYYFENDQATFKASQKLINYQKYKYWDNIQNLKNHHSFTITKNENYTAYFDTIKVGITLKNILAENQNCSGVNDSIYFKDPWFIDYPDPDYGDNLRNRGMKNTGPDALRFWKRSSPFIPDYDTPFSIGDDKSQKYQGVFLDQRYDIPNNPHYSVKAEAQQTFTAHGQDITGYFLGWEGTDVVFEHPDQQESAVVFQAEGAEARAVYKGHLASSVARATGYNNGRRMYKASNGTIYLVYEDNGDIWFTSSTDGGKTWSKETQLDSNTKTSLNPSLAGTLDMLFVAWFDKTDLNIKLRKFNINTSQWYNSYNVASVNFGEAIKPAPAIAVSEVVGNEYNVYIAFHREKMSENFQPTGIHEIVCYKNSDQNFNQWNLILGPFEGRNPSLSHSQTGNNGDIGLVWDHNGKIYFKGTNYYGNWTSTYQISDNLWYHQDNCKPNISYTAGIAHIVWEGFHAVTEMPTGYYRYFKVDEERLSDLTVLPSHGADVHHLSVSSKKYADNTEAYDYTVVYEGDGIVKVTQTSDNFEEENFGEGKYPNITEHDMSRSVWTKYNDAPYLLKTDYVESSGGGISPIIINPTPVIDYVISANQNNSVEGTITLEVEAVKFNHDTIYFDNALKSKTMNVTQNYVPLEMDLKVRFHNVYNGFDDEDVLYSLVFDDSTQGEIFLTDLKYKELPTPNGADFEKFFKVTTIVNLAGKTGKICLKTNGITPSLVTKRLDIFGQSTLNKSKPETAVIPENFALRQNFPNPFNPVTHITVELAQAAKVDLSVYTINGKKVQTLLRGHQSAGIYEVIFDGRNLASGVYIYQLTTDKGFKQSRKMMLIK